MFVTGTKTKQNSSNINNNNKNLPASRKTLGTSVTANEVKLMDSPKNTSNIKNIINNTAINKNNNNSVRNNNNNNQVDRNVPKRLVRSKYTESTPTYARPTISTTTRDIITARQLKAKTDKKPASPATLSIPIERKNLNTKLVNAVDMPGLPINTQKPDFKIPKSKDVFSKDSPRFYKKPLQFEDLDLSSDMKSSRSIETGVQSNEPEILNHELIVGDVKLLLPSPQLVAVIEQDRKEQRRMDLVNNARKYDANNTSHLDDLKEFLESAAIVRRPNKPTPPPPPPKPVKSAKNKLHALEKKLKAEVSKADSHMSLRTRIKQKEVELLSLFDNVDKF